VRTNVVIVVAAVVVSLLLIILIHCCCWRRIIRFGKICRRKRGEEGAEDTVPISKEGSRRAEARRGEARRASKVQYSTVNDGVCLLLRDPRSRRSKLNYDYTVLIWFIHSCIILVEMYAMSTCVVLVIVIVIVYV